jgi:hypothetical protein
MKIKQNVRDAIEKKKQAGNEGCELGLPFIDGQGPVPLHSV